MVSSASAWVRVLGVRQTNSTRGVCTLSVKTWRFGSAGPKSALARCAVSDSGGLLMPPK